MRGARNRVYAAGALATQLVFGTPLMFLPLLLERRCHAGPMVIGGILALMPALTLVVMPLGNALGERLGRRRPLMLAGVPLVAAGLVGIAAAGRLAEMVLVLAVAFVGLNLFLGAYRASLAEQVEPSEYGAVSGWQALFKGIGTLAVLTGGGLLYARGDGLPFLAAAGLFVPIALFAIGATRARRASPSPRVAWRAYAEILRAFPSLWGAQFGAWFAVHACLAYTVLFYVHDVLGVASVASPAGKAAAVGALPLLTIFALTSMLAALPVSRAAKAWGERRVLLGGLLLLALGVVIGGTAHATPPLYAFAVLGGIGYATLLVLPYPMMLRRLAPAQSGTLTVLLVNSVELPQLIGLPTLGWLVAGVGSYRAIYAAACAALAIAVWLLGRMASWPRSQLSSPGAEASRAPSAPGSA